MIKRGSLREHTEYAQKLNRAQSGGDENDAATEQIRGDSILVPPQKLAAIHRDQEKDGDDRQQDAVSRLCEEDDSHRL